MRWSGGHVSEGDRERRRVVIVAPNWLGDIVMALPAVTAIRRHFSTDAVAVAVAQAMAPVFHGILALDRVVPLQGGRDGIGPDADRLADGQFDVAILFPNSFRSAWVTRRAGIAQRWGYLGQLRGWLLTRAVRRPSRRERRHQADDYRALVRGLDIPVDVEAASLVATQAQTARAAALLERHRVTADTPRVVVAPGATNGHAKRWLPERFAELARRVATELDRTVLLVGSPGDRASGRAVESALTEFDFDFGFGLAPSNDGRIVNLIGHTDLSELMGVLSGCEVCVSNDTGTMHLASALGVPVVALFGPSDEQATAPLGRHEILTRAVRCRPCLLRDCPIDHRCMRGIPTADVFEAVSRLAGWPS